MPMEEATKPVKKITRSLEGVVISDRMQKTIVVAVTRMKKHQKYKKQFKVTKKYKAHNENDEYKVGDIVVIEESRPLSKEKKWAVVKKGK